MEVPWLGPSVFFSKLDEGMEGTWASLQVVLSWGSSRYTGGKGHPLEGLLWAGGMGCWDPPAAQPGQMLVQPLVVVVQDGAHGLRTTSSLGSGQQRETVIEWSERGRGRQDAEELEYDRLQQ